MEIETTVAALFRADPEPLLNHREPANDDRMKPARPLTWHFWAECFTSQENQLFGGESATEARDRAMPFMKYFANSPKAKTRHVAPYPISSLNPLDLHAFCEGTMSPEGGNG